MCATVGSVSFFPTSADSAFRARVGIAAIDYLKKRGYESEIFVETADRRLEDLTVDYRDLPEASHPDNLLIHHFSIGSRASRVAYALPDRMARRTGNAFRRAVAPAARHVGVELTEVNPLDDDLESVFRYLVEGR